MATFIAILVSLTASANAHDVEIVVTIFIIAVVVKVNVWILANQDHRIVGIDEIAGSLLTSRQRIPNANDAIDLLCDLPSAMWLKKCHDVF